MTHKRSNNDKRNMPYAWQMNPENVTTDHVQYWRNGSMLTALMTNATARELVKTGKAFVITDQAIGALHNGQYAD